MTTQSPCSCTNTENFHLYFAVCIRDIVCYPLQDFKKQDTEVGKLLTNTVLLIYILRIVFTALSDIGVLPNFFMCVPFVVTGGMFIIYDMALVGIILSVNRNESIAKDWIKLKASVTLLKRRSTMKNSYVLFYS